MRKINILVFLTVCTDRKGRKGINYFKAIIIINDNYLKLKDHHKIKQFNKKETKYYLLTFKNIKSIIRKTASLLLTFHGLGH